MDIIDRLIALKDPKTAGKAFLKGLLVVGAATVVIGLTVTGRVPGEGLAVAVERLSVAFLTLLFVKPWFGIPLLLGSGIVLEMLFGDKEKK